MKDQIDCVTSSGAEQAIMLTSSVEFIPYDAPLEILGQSTEEFYDPLRDLTYERTYVAVENKGTGMGYFRLKARCMIP